MVLMMVAMFLFVVFAPPSQMMLGIRMLQSSDPDSTLSQKKLNAAVHRRQERARRCGHEQRATRAGPLDRWCAQP